MDTKSAPALVPALGFLAGTLLAVRLQVPPGPACALLAALGFALRRPAGYAVAFAALGLLNAQLRWLEPREALRSLRVERPVEVLADVVAHPIPADGDLLLRVRTRRLAQNGAVFTASLEVFVTLPAGASNAAAAAEPAIGQTLRLRGYLRRSPGFANRAEVRPGRWRMRLKSARFLSVEERAGPIGRWASGLRRHTEATIGAAAERRPDSAGLALARVLLLGDRSELPTSQRQVLRRLGLTHLLAVSGLHVGLLAVLVLLAGRPLPRSWRYLLTLAAVATYLLLIGPRPAILRASIMGLLALAALLAHRPPQAVNALSWSLFALIAPAPWVVTELGFQLSFAATAGLIVLSPRFADRWKRWPRTLRLPLAASFSAQVVTLPLLLPHTGTLHPSAVVWNLVAVPWLAGFLLAAFPWLLLAWVSLPAAEILVPVLDLLASPLSALTHLAPTVADLRLVTGPASAGWILAGALAAVAWWPRHGAAALLLLVAVGLQGARSVGTGPAELVMIDVGQGDAVVLRDGARSLLVDGGGWPRGDLGAKVLLPALAASRIRRLDAVLMTHSDVDHCGGLADLVRYLPITEVWTGPLELDSDETPPCVRRLLRAPGPAHRVVKRGDVLRLGRWRLEVLHPAAGEAGGANDRSVVVMAELGESRVLLTGDLEAGGERLVADRSPDLRADVLKVAHHGSKTSTGLSWLRAVAPRIALVSAGWRNHYGHPAPEIVERLRREGVRVLRTDLSGRVRLRFEDHGRILIDLPVWRRPGLVR